MFPSTYCSHSTAVSVATLVVGVVRANTARFDESQVNSGSVFLVLVHVLALVFVAAAAAAAAAAVAVTVPAPARSLPGFFQRNWFGAWVQGNQQQANQRKLVKSGHGHQVPRRYCCC